MPWRNKRLPHQFGCYRLALSPGLGWWGLVVIHRIVVCRIHAAYQTECCIDQITAWWSCAYSVTCSNTFQQTDVKATGRQLDGFLLSPFLKIGVTVATSIFQSVGVLPNAVMRPGRQVQEWFHRPFLWVGGWAVHRDHLLYEGLIWVAASWYPFAWWIWLACLELNLGPDHGALSRPPWWKQKKLGCSVILPFPLGQTFLSGEMPLLSHFWSLFKVNIYLLILSSFNMFSM